MNESPRGKDTRGERGLEGYIRDEWFALFTPSSLACSVMSEEISETWGMKLEDARSVWLCKPVAYIVTSGEPFMFKRNGAIGASATFLTPLNAPAPRNLLPNAYCVFLPPFFFSLHSYCSENTDSLTQVEPSGVARKHNPDQDPDLCGTSNYPSPTANVSHGGQRRIYILISSLHCPRCHSAADWRVLTLSVTPTPRPLTTYLDTTTLGAPHE